MITSVLKKRVLPVVGGLFAGWVAIFILEALNHQVYPPPADVNFTDKESMALFIEGLPTGAFVLLLITWMVGAVLAGMLTARLNREHWKNNAIITGVVLALGAIINMTLVPHPTWLVIVASVGFVPATILGARFTLVKK